MFDITKDLKKWVQLLDSSIRFDTPISKEAREELKELLEHEIQMKEVNQKFIYNRSHGHNNGY